MPFGPNRSGVQRCVSPRTHSARERQHSPRDQAPLEVVPEQPDAEGGGQRRARPTATYRRMRPLVIVTRLLLSAGWVLTIGLLCAACGPPSLPSPPHIVTTEDRACVDGCQKMHAVCANNAAPAAHASSTNFVPHATYRQRSGAATSAVAPTLSLPATVVARRVFLSRCGAGLSIPAVRQALVRKHGEGGVRRDCPDTDVRPWLRLAC